MFLLLLFPRFGVLDIPALLISETDFLSFGKPELYRMDDIVLDNCVISVSQVTSGTVISFAFSDGSLELRDR